MSKKTKATETTKTTISALALTENRAQSKMMLYALLSQGEVTVPVDAQHRTPVNFEIEQEVNSDTQTVTFRIVD